MKYLILSTLFLSQLSWAQQTTPWTETFELPEGITYRARAAGYDCGEFGSTYVAVPRVLAQESILFGQLAADKDLNKFLIEAEFPSYDGNRCIYGVYLDRNRDDKTLDFNHSVVTSGGGFDEACDPGKEILDAHMQKVAYEGSKRGLRYIAVQIMTNVENEVCESKNVRIVFDRRPPQ